jgi:predicted AAA+ superfamily ATPase
VIERKDIADELLDLIRQAGMLYYRLVLILGPVGSGKTTLLRYAEDKLSSPIINVGLELSRRLISLTAEQRKLEIGTILEEVVGSTRTDIVLMDNLEVLFDPGLEQDPLRLLQGLSRNRTIVATWNGSITDGQLIYAEPQHFEYRKYKTQDFLFLNVDGIE